MSSRRKRKAPACGTGATGAGAGAATTVAAIAAAAANATAPSDGVASAAAHRCPEAPRQILRRLRGRRRGAARVHLPTVRVRDQHVGSGGGEGGGAGGGTARVPRSRAAKDRKLVSPRNGVVLNLSLFDDLELDLDDNDDDSGGGGAGARAAPTTDLLVAWNPAEASENHVVYEVYNVHVHLHGLFAAHSRLPAPIVLANQVYSMVGDRTTADREIRELADRGVFRILRSPRQFPHDTCIVLESEFHACVAAAIMGEDAAAATTSSSAAASLSASSSSSSSSAAAGGAAASTSAGLLAARKRLRRCFQRCVRAHRGQSVCSLSDLRARLREKRVPPTAALATLIDGARVLDAPPTPLEDVPRGAAVNAAADHAPFRLPFLPAFLSELSAARKELVKLITRRRYGEMPWVEAVAVNLKTTELPTELVVRDLVGSGRLLIASVTTAGRVLRVAGGYV